MALPIAVQFYSVRDEAEKDFFGTLKKIKDMGYEIKDKPLSHLVPGLY